MRIVGGQWSGQTLFAPKVETTRPTSDALRETLFNVLDHRYGHSYGKVLDLFAGSGALGFEALSRGASTAVFVESNTKAIHSIQRNASNLGCENQIQVLSTADTKLWAKDLRKFGVKANTVFCDPPYSKGLADKTFLNLAPAPLWEAGTIWVQEKFKKDPPLSSLPMGWQLLERRERGDSGLEFFVFSGTSPSQTTL